MMQALGNPLSYRNSAFFYICPNTKAHKATDGKPMIYCEAKPQEPQTQKNGSGNG